MFQRNSIGRWAFVILVRVPILAPFVLVQKIGQAAETVGGWIADKLPGLRP